VCEERHNRVARRGVLSFLSSSVFVRLRASAAWCYKEGGAAQLASAGLFLDPQNPSGQPHGALHEMK
jgi:hypothetical protein